jgi:hypothetical protein
MQLSMGFAALNPSYALHLVVFASTVNNAIYVVADALGVDWRSKRPRLLRAGQTWMTNVIRFMPR